MTAQLTRWASPASVADKLVAVHTMVDKPEWCANLGKNWDAKA